MEKPISKLINTIQANPDCGVFEILNSDNDNPIEWEIKPTTLQLIPNGEGHYLTKAYRIEKNGLYKSAYINVSTPERIIDFVIYDLKKPSYSYAYNSINIEVIPAVASDCFGSYEVYYSRNNPDLSIEVLKQGLEISKEKNVIAEDLGYILRDEDRPKEALKYFLISEENGASSEFILGEIERIYRILGSNEKADEYQLKLDEIKTAGNKT
ncbi:tetratricopeptide repeat protein [Leeuwenhoekiella sp. W20_SRS_FM14]|uniref:tetratricopeptide repeat protein n=1 Tax=Leeuwenhoekiella sp. W20_SRS_FM14 TaxID=3240270 RepID=UPI003F967A12